MDKGNPAEKKKKINVSSLDLGRDINAGQKNRGRMGSDPFGLQGKSETSKGSNMYLNFGRLTIKELDLEIL